MRRSFAVVRVCSIFVLVFASGVFGQAGPPVIGDDPGTPGNGHWEINVAYPFIRTPHQVTMETPHLDLNYGLGDHIQLKYEVGWLLGKEEGDHWTGGVNNSLAGVKWRFLDEEKNGIDMSTYPQLGFNTTLSLARAGVVDKGIDLFLPIEIGKTFGKLELAAEAGYQYVEHGTDQFVAGLVLGYRVTENLELLIEGRDALDLDLRRNELVFDGGGRVILNDNFALIAAAGRTVESGDGSTLLYVYAGLRITF